ncbi:MAG: hypothetical protein KAS71_13040 [Bacteroidales bacterium]|nr:hypothetical protein [Bacteroidales bacterium]
MKRKENKSNDFLSYSKENAFVAPEGYFENFSDRLNERIHNEQKSSGQKKTISLKAFLNSKLAMAASFLIFITISYFTVNIIFNLNNVDNSQYYADLVDYEIADFDLGLLVEYYLEDEYIDEDEYYSDKDAEIIDFLVAEDIDIELIIEEF